VPSIKCSACGQRILNPGIPALCPNCGEPLELQVSAPHSSGSSTAEEDLFSQIVVDDQPSASGAYTDDTAPNPVISPSRTDSQFPKGSPKRPPDLTGTVILVESREELKRSSGVGDTIFDSLLDFIWAIPGGPVSLQSQSKEKERIQVTRVRIRTDDDQQKDVRLEGRLTAVSIAQGDQVSLWGKERKGLLAFEYGYNHTTKGSITTSRGTSQKSGLLLLIVVGLLGVIVLGYYYYRGGNLLSP
jgi:translation initiation factor IF-1